MIKELPEIDIVVVATPSGMHFEHGMEFLENYRKHVIIELLDAITMPYQSDVLCQEEHIRTYFPDPRSSPRFSISPTCITSLFF